MARRLPAPPPTSSPVFSAYRRGLCMKVSTICLLATLIAGQAGGTTGAESRSVNWTASSIATEEHKEKETDVQRQATAEWCDAPANDCEFGFTMCPSVYGSVEA